MVNYLAPFNEPAGKVVLLAEDDPLTSDCVQRMLNHEGFQVLAARHGEAALDIWRHRRDEVHLLLTDLNMPGIGGLELAATLTSDAKDLKTIFISGYPDLIADAEDISASLFLQKPFTPVDLTNKIKAIINAPLHGWRCPSCHGHRYQGNLVDSDGHTTKITFECDDCGTEHMHVSEVSCFHRRCPLCGGPVLLGGYGYVGGRDGTWYLEQGCWQCKTKIVHHSPNCPTLPYTIPNSEK